VGGLKKRLFHFQSETPGTAPIVTHLPSPNLFKLADEYKIILTCRLSKQVPCHFRITLAFFYLKRNLISHN
jgi:hypothetical protein